MRDFLSFLGVIGQQLLNVLWYDRIAAVAGFRIRQVREQAEVDFFEKGFKAGEQAEADRRIAEGGEP